MAFDIEQKNPGAAHNIVSGTPPPVVPQGVWFDTEWPYRVPIVIPSGTVSSTLSNYPLYIRLSDLPSHFHENVKSDGSDIRVATSTGTPLAQDLVFYDSVTDTGELHVLLPSLPSGSDTTLFVYYGHPNVPALPADAMYGSQAVWGDYAIVYHLHENSGNPLDATGNTTATFSGSLPDGTTQQLGRGQDFDGTGDYFEIASSASLSSTYQTISFWLKSDANAGKIRAYMERRTGFPSGQFIYYHDGVTNTVNWNHAGSGTTWNTGYAPPTDGTRVLLHFVFANDPIVMGAYEKYLYVNAAYQGKQDTPTDIQHESVDLRIGEGVVTTGREFDGEMDEFRIATTARSSAFITAEYENQATPTSFYTLYAYQDGGFEGAGLGADLFGITLYGEATHYSENDAEISYTPRMGLLGMG